MPREGSEGGWTPESKRIAASAIAGAAWIGLAIHFDALFRANRSVFLTVWILLAFFTVTANLLVAVVFTGIAAGKPLFARAWLVAGTALSILLVGVVYALLLHGLQELTGGSVIANVLLHRLTPILVPLFWFVFVEKGTLSPRDPLLFAIYPICYLFYALIRGAFSGRYAYPFLDGGQLGWWQVGGTVLAISAGYLIAGWLFVKLDKRLGQSGVTRPLA